jgi:hypothetical protein
MRVEFGPGLTIEQEFRVTTALPAKLAADDFVL